MRKIHQKPDIDAALHHLPAKLRQPRALTFAPRIERCIAGLGDVGMAEMVERQIGGAGLAALSRRASRSAWLRRPRGPSMCAPSNDRMAQHRPAARIARSSAALRASRIRPPLAATISWT